ncbi:MAG: rod shape-determining protein RodA [Halomonas sp.]|nr:rod shape-determining protein RodA [Halomonas sp.]
MPWQAITQSLRGRPVRTSGGIPKRRSIWERIHLDPWLLGLLLVLMGSGLLVIYSASGQSMNVVIAQAIRFGVALMAMLIVAQFSPIFFLRWAPVAYGIGVLMLVAVELVGDVGMGAQRWLVIPGVIRFQPSEMMKLAVPMMVAAYLYRCELPPKLKDIVVCALIIGLPVALIAAQPDLGTSLLVASAAIIVVLLAGLSWRLIGLVCVLLASGFPLLWMNLHNYQRQRILTFLNPDTDPLGSGWGEEVGLIGMVILILLYLLIVSRGLWLASESQNTFGRLVAGSIILTFFIYVFVNIGMVSGILPVVGVPLPLVSYGGTSSVTLLVGFGILMSIHAHRRLLPR